MSAGATTNSRDLTLKTLQPNPIGSPQQPRVTPWQRPNDWLPLPVINEGSGQQLVAGLHAIFPGENYCAFTVSGAYTVDWGDGTVQNYAAGTTASRIYNYSTYDPGNSTLTSQGYKQAVIQIYPQAGQNLTSVNLNVRHPNITQTYRSGFLDLAVIGSSITALLIGVASVGSTSSNVLMTLLQQAMIYNNAVTDMSTMLYNCRALIKARVQCGSATIMQSTFNLCQNLREVELLNTQLVTNMTSLFNNCSNLQTVPLFDTSSVTTMSSMFSNCVQLREVPLFNTVNVSVMSLMFSTCINLQRVPLFNTPNLATMSSMFSLCSTLQTVPQFNTANVTTMLGAFQNCTSLRTVPLFNTANVTSMSTMFNGCTSLRTVPLFNTANVTNMSQMFNGCTSLRTVPQFDTAKVTNMSSMFNSCRQLTTVGQFSTGNVANMASMFSTCSSLREAPALNMTRVFDTSSMFSSCAELKSVTFTTPTTRSGNMTSMFNGCINLESVFNFDASGATNMTNCFANCQKLVTAPPINSKSCSTFSSLFSDCFALNSANVDFFNGTGTTSVFVNSLMSVADLQFANINTTLSVQGQMLNQTQLNNLVANTYPNPTTSRTLTVTGNPASNTSPITRTGNLTSTSRTVVMTNTTGVNVGMSVIGTGMPYATLRTLTSIDYGDSTFTFTSHGLVADSPIAINSLNLASEAGTMPTVLTWVDVAAGNGVFVAVGGTGNSTAGRSTDGVTWSSVTLPSSGTWTSITYGNGLFVAVAGSTTNYATSPDGINWTLRFLPSSPGGSPKVVFAGQFFFIIGDSLNSILSSDTGISNWTTINLPITTTLGRVAFGNGIYVLTPGTSTVAYATSYDGINWDSRTFPTSLNYRDIVFADGRFVVIGTGTTTSLYGGNGLTWTQASIPSGNWQRLAYGDGIYVAIAESTNNFAISPNGSTWRSSDITATQQWQSIAFQNNRFAVIAGRTSSTTVARSMAYSNIDIEKVYYARDITTNTFKIAATPGGAALAIYPAGPTGKLLGGGTYRAGSYVTQVTANTSIILSAPATSTTNNVSLTFRDGVDPMPALMKNWAVTF